MFRFELAIPCRLLQGCHISVILACPESFFFSSANQPRLKEGFPTSGNDNKQHKFNFIYSSIGGGVSSATGLPAAGSPVFENARMPIHTKPAIGTSSRRPSHLFLPRFSVMHIQR